MNSKYQNYSLHFAVQINLDKTNESLTLMEENLLGRDAALTATEEELNKVNNKINIDELLLSGNKFLRF